MKSLKSLLAATAILFVGALTATAQNSKYADREETRSYPYAFVGVQGGVQAILNGYNLKDVVTPVGGVNAGAWFSPSLGARVQAYGWRAKEGVKKFGTYYFSYGAASLDALVNLTNAFSKTDNHAFNVILLGGLGANKAWGNHYARLNNADGTRYFYNGDPVVSETEIGSKVHNHVAFQARAGLMFDLNVSRNLSISLEGDINHVGSRGYAHSVNGANDWQLVGLVGITYKFGSKAKKAAPEPEPAPVIQPQPQPKPEAKPEPKPEPKPAPVVKEKENMKKEIFFIIAKTVPSGAEAAKVSEVAEWLNAHPTATATVKGYADKGTGSHKINERYARGRAENVAKELTDKYGIAPWRLSVSSYGDTVQPKPNNDDNRLVIVVAEEK